MPLSKPRYCRGLDVASAVAETAARNMVRTWKILLKKALGRVRRQMIHVVEPDELGPIGLNVVEDARGDRWEHCTELRGGRHL